DAAGGGRDPLDAVIGDPRPVLAPSPAPDMDAAIAAVGDEVVGKREPAGFDRPDADIAGAGDGCPGDPAGDPLEVDAGARAADDHAVVDDEIRRCGDVEEA